MFYNKLIKCILFDLDGVLVDACNWHYEALNAALIESNLDPINLKDHKETYNGLPTKVKLNMLGIKDDKIFEINNLKQKHTLNIINANAKIMQEKIELHEYLKSLNIKIACVTNSIRETAELMLHKTGQLNYIDLLVTNEDVSPNKPHPVCYNYAIQKLNADANTALCVEDSPKGIEAATKSVVKNLWVVKCPKEVTKNNFLNYIKTIKEKI
jgi:HAD superfamily hydrolase (TIGR01509 family)